MLKTFVLLAVILSCNVNSEPVDFYPEKLCNAVGGQCILKDECPYPIKYLNRCPRQQHFGAECCHGVSIKEYRCHRFGGECVVNGSRCPYNLQVKRPTNCPAGTFCCILI
ncbi:hypothetical protein RN001_008423 [Aquatica leii]|uniref:Uncharacterized protein n=1 Tax=Aquatica leii TaxID=1421715 RepID=A0AAN7SGP6_9COLE|nr:hypothetical protein RN001_008423 [Aquatica leii]